MDHLERARREEEAPLLAKLFEEQSKENEELWHQQQEEARRAHRWVGARQRVSGWKHPLQSTVVGRFADLQKKVWTT